MAFYKGTSLSQDGRFKNKDKKLISQMIFPPEYETQVYKDKINISLIKSWIDKRLNDILNFEDECISNYIINLIEESEEVIEPKKIHYAMTGFLDNQTYDFMKDLWKLLISAQNAKDGIPRELIEEKKKEIIDKNNKQQVKIKFLDELLKKEGDYEERRDRMKDRKERYRNRSRSRSRSRSGSFRKSKHHQHHNHHRREHYRGSKRKEKYSSEEEYSEKK